MWVVFASLSALFASLVAIFAKLGLQDLDSTLATTIRSIIMALFLVVVSIFLRKFEGFSINSLETKDWLLITLAGISGAMSWLFYFFALKIGLTSHVAVIDKLSIVLVIFLSVLFLGESLDFKSFLGIILLVFGSVLITLK